MPLNPTECEVSVEQIRSTVRRYWGFDQLRPMQEQAIRAGLEQRDSLVVLPTGGGKSLCYQVPPAVAGRTDVVVSPLISLMKDQVDGLHQCGYPAAALHSNLSASETAAIEREIAGGRCRLVFVAPERLLGARCTQLLAPLDIRAIAIDEAHCISHWGHDFRPEYRQLAALKDRFPQASIHAYTATATERVREDIVAQLGLRQPQVLVGVFDRPNLTYRVLPRVDLFQQVRDVLKRHAREAAIVYCISRRETESLASRLAASGVQANFYHAGMDASDRRRVQDAFAEERLDVVVATVAFGMGIDRSDVRCVIHAAMPKSIEHYQQETGRAGRDGLEAECVLLYSPADVIRWQELIAKSVAESDAPEETIAAMTELLQHMRLYASIACCRHRTLSEYFGQRYEKADCGACDVCLKEVAGLSDGTVVAQKILSCVARVQERFGVTHVVDVLLGADTEMIQRCRHQELSTYGLLKGTNRKDLTNYVYQLVDQQLLARDGGEYPILRLNDASWEVMRGKRPVQLQEVRRKETRRSKGDEKSWEGVDRGLFENLRELRRSIAQELGVPAFMVFGDATLRELARHRPQSLEALQGVYGIGRRKLGEFGERFIDRIAQYCREHGVSGSEAAHD